MQISGQKPSDDQPIEKITPFSAKEITLPASFTNGTSLDEAKKAESSQVETKSSIQDDHPNSPKFVQAFCAALLLIKTK